VSHCLLLLVRLLLKLAHGLWLTLRLLRLLLCRLSLGRACKSLSWAFHVFCLRQPPAGASIP
jgi:hypothetical protein